MEYKEKTIEIVLLDDNPAIRIAMHILLERIKPLGARINIYTSQDGVQGLGYIAITNPHLIIIDATLPKYSGRELTEYLSSNPKYSDKHILILSNGKESNFPNNYYVIDKRSKDFVHKLENKVKEVLRITSKERNKLQRSNERIVRTVIKATISTGNFSDRLIDYERRKGFIFKLLFVLPWVLSQIAGSMCLGLLRILCGRTDNANIVQKNKDDIVYRVRYYPTLIAVILTVLFLIIQLLAYLIGGLFILSQTDRVPVVTASCTPAYDNSYCYRKTITIDNTKVSGSTDLSNFPMLFSGTYSYLATTANSGYVENANGYDIIFTSDAAGSTKLAHEIESWSATTGAINAWVKIPTLGATSDTVIYLFYGNSSVSTSQEDITNVWDSNYQMVQHLKETSGTHYDSTSNNNDSTSITITTQGSATGKINGADNFDGTDDYINIADGNSLDLTNAGTISAWVNPDAVTASSSNFSSWTALTAPDGNGYLDSAEVDTVIVGNKIYYAAFLHYGATETFGIGNSNLDGSSQTSWTYLTAPDGAGEYEMSSVSVDSDGTKLYYAVLANSDDVEAFATGYSNLDGSSFSGWTSRTAPNGTGINDRPSISATIVGSKLYMAAYLHDNATETFYTSSVNLDGTTFSGWTSRTAPDGAQHGSSVGLGIDSDGAKLYYAAYAGYTGSSGTDPATEYFYTAYSDLDWSNFSSWTSQSAPNGTGAYDPGFIDMIVAGGRQYFAAYLHTDTTKYFSTANATLDGSSMTSWTAQTAPSGSTRDKEGTNTSISSDGKKLYYIAYSQYIETEALELATADITNMPIISKSDAYELILSGSGIVLDWAGPQPKSFGALSASSFTHVAITLDGSNMKMYINGVEKRSEPTTVDFASNSNALKIGGNAKYFDGVIDEARVSSTARSVDWIMTEYNNQNSPSTFYSIAVPILSLSSSGSQSSTLSVPSTNQYAGGTFVISNTATETPNLTSITIREQGSVDAQNNLDNIKLYYDLDVSAPYDCASESYAGTETQYGSTDADGFNGSNGTSAFSGSLAVSSTQTICLYVVFDVVSNAGGGQTIEIDIANPSTDLVFSAGSISSTSPVSISGTTTIDCPEFANGYCYYKSIAIDYTKVSGGSNLANFPFGYIVTDTGLKTVTNGGKVQSSSGYDIIFTSDELGSTLLDYEIERFDGATGDLIAWVEIPTLSASANTTIYMYYNKTSATNQQNPTGVWDSNYVVVNHLSEDPSGTAPQMLDSTSNNNDGTTNNMEAGDLISCKIGNCLNLDGSNEYVKKTDNSTLSFGGTAVTIQAWVYVPTSHPTYAIVAGKNRSDGSHTAPYFEYSLHFVDTGYPRMFVATGTGSGNYLTAQSSTVMGVDGWHFLVGTYDGSNIKIYMDNVEKGSTANTATIPDFTGPYNIGANGEPSEFLKGRIDEVRVSKVKRTTGWMTTEYNNQNAPSTFATTSSEYAGSTNYAPIVTNVSLNGGSNISLTESTTTNISWTASVTDINGYGNISSVNGKVYRSGVTNAQNCTTDDNNCYADASCDLSSCSGSTCTATCTAAIQFHADPTVTGTTYASEYWLGWISATDGGSLTDNDFSPNSLTEVNTLVALNITNPSISYGTLVINQNTGSSNQVIAVTNVGNVPIDGEISGSGLCPDYPTCAGDSITVGNQEYSLSTFTYGSGSDLTGTATGIQLNLSKPTASPSNSSTNIYWGIAIPTLSTLGVYSGQNTLLAVAE